MKTIQKKWSVTSLEVVPDLNDKNLVVTKVYWKLSVTWDAYESSMIGTVDLPMIGDAFTEFNDLTEEQVLGWVFEKLGDDVAVNENMLRTQLKQDVVELAEMDNSPVVVSPPWLDSN